MLYTVNEINDRTIPVAKKHGLKNVQLFGSYAKNAASQNSDIDLVTSSGIADDFLMK